MPGFPYNVCKVHKAIEDNCSSFRPILVYKINKFLVPKVTFLTSNELAVKDTLKAYFW